MKPVRWTRHALANLTDRGINREEAERALIEPEFVASAGPNRRVAMRRYTDEDLRQQMLLLIVVEDTPAEEVVITAYKTSNIRRYLKGVTS